MHIEKIDYLREVDKESLVIIPLDKSYTIIEYHIIVIISD